MEERALTQLNLLTMIFRQLAAFIFALFLCCFTSPAQAYPYPPPLSFSNAQLRGRDFSGQTLQLAEFSNANLERANFSRADLRGAVLSASILLAANLHGADLTNALVDQVNFTNADLSDTVLAETILLGSIFDGANIAGADFSDAILDGTQIRQLCAKASGINSKTSVPTRESLGCR